MKQFIGERGSVLVMSLIIGSGMAIAGIELGLLVVGQIQQAKNSDFTSAAGFAAESGLEHALYEIRKEERTDLRMQKDSAFENKARWTLENASSTTRFASEINSLYRARIVENDSAVIDLYTETTIDGSTTISKVAGAQSLTLTWQTETCAPATAPEIEVSAVAWKDGSINWGSDTRVMKKSFTSPGKTVTAAFVDFVDAEDPSYTLLDKPMVVQIKVYNCSLGGVTITINDKPSPSAQDNKLLKIPNYFLLNPAGTYGGVTKEYSALIPRRETHSGLFDFILFSEQPVCKNDTSSTACP